MITWLVDGTNVDPAFTEPSGEVAYDRHELTTIGGSVNLYSDQGAGLEEYAIHKAPVGEYKIDTNYYDAGRAELLGAATVYVDVFTNYGRPNQRHKSLIIHLQPSKETISLGKVEFHPPARRGFKCHEGDRGTATRKKGGRQATAMRFQWKGFIELPLGEKGVKGRFRLVGNALVVYPRTAGRTNSRMGYIKVGTQSPGHTPLRRVRPSVLKLYGRRTLPMRGGCTGAATP